MLVGSMSSRTASPALPLRELWHRRRARPLSSLCALPRRAGGRSQSGSDAFGLQDIQCEFIPGDYGDNDKRAS